MMITYRFKGPGPRLGFIFNEMSSYIGVKVVNKGKKPVITFLPQGGEEPRARALIFMKDLDDGFKPETRSEFQWKGMKVPVYGKNGSKGKGHAILTDGNGRTLIALESTTSPIKVSINFDILNPMFYHLSGEEEIKCKDLDEFGRFQHTSSILHREGLLLTPVATVYMDVIRHVLVEVFKALDLPFVRIWPWPEGKRYAIGLSHDVDEIKRWTLKKSAHLLIQKKAGRSIKAFLGSIEGLKGNEYWTFERIMGIEDELSVRSTFFMSGLNSGIRAGRPAKQRRYYEIAYDTDPKAIQALYREIGNKGWEMGLHASFSANNDPKRLTEERKNISKAAGREVSGVRQHFLKFTVPDYFRSLAKAGFQYDASMGYSTTYGFRRGACYPYQIYDATKEDLVEILEIPLSLMEVTLSDKNKVNPGRITKEAWKVIGPVSALNGGFSLLWHNNRFVEDEFPGWGEAYRMLLEKCMSDDCHLSDLSDIHRWITMKNRVGIEYGSNEVVLSSPEELNGLTLEITANDDYIKNFRAKIPDSRIVKRTKSKLLLIIDKLHPKKKPVIPLK